jgi:hypothetical protein
MDTSTIKSYLISLGFEADDNMYRKFSTALAKASSEVEKNTSIMSNAYVKSGGIIVGAIGTIVASTTMLLDSLAKADLGYEKYAMRMYMARDAAKQFKIVTDSMGESLEDIAWIPELNEKYKALMAEAKKMELPKEYQEEMKMIRGIGFEFTRLKVESIYGLQWIGHNLIKNLKDPLTGVKGSFKDLNDYIVEKMPEWSEKIATTFGNMLAILKDNTMQLGELGGKLKDFWDNLSPESKKAAIVAGGVGAFIYGGPKVKAMVALGALSTVSSEQEAMKRGEKTVLPTWWLQSTEVMKQGTYSLLRNAGNAINAAAITLSPSLTWAEKNQRKQAIWDKESKRSVIGELNEQNPLWSLSGAARDRNLDRWIMLHYPKLDPKYAKMEVLAASETGGDPYLLEAIRLAEGGSSDPKSKKFMSSAGAKGLMQMMPAQGQKYLGGIYTDDYTSILGAAKLLKDIGKYKGVAGDVSKMAAWYNGGDPDRPKSAANLKENQDYINKVTETYIKLAGQSSNAYTSEAEGESQQQDIHIDNVFLNNYKPNEAGRAANDFVTTLTARTAKGTRP